MSSDGVIIERERESACREQGRRELGNIWERVIRAPSSQHPSRKSISRYKVEEVGADFNATRSGEG